MQKIEKNRQTRYRESYRIHDKHATVQQDQKHRKSCPQLPFPRENGSHCSKACCHFPHWRGPEASLATASPASTRAEATWALCKPLPKREIIPAEQSSACWSHCALQPLLHKGQAELTECQPGLWPPRQGLTSSAKFICAKQVSDSTERACDQSHLIWINLQKAILWLNIF